MAASYVTVAQLRSNLGIGSLYSDADLESICQTSEGRDVSGRTYPSAYTSARVGIPFTYDAR